MTGTKLLPKNMTATTVGRASGKRHHKGHIHAATYPNPAEGASIVPHAVAFAVVLLVRGADVVLLR